MPKYRRKWKAIMTHRTVPLPEHMRRRYYQAVWFFYQAAKQAGKKSKPD
jgi:hypothetical protein